MAASKNARLTAALLLGALLACSAPALRPRFDFQAVGPNPLWLAAPRNSTGSSLRLPGTNPLRSLAEMAGKVAADDRPTVMDLLRESLKREFAQRKTIVGFPEEADARLSTLPPEAEGSARLAREGKLTGVLLLSEIRRWDGEAAGLIRLWVEFKLVRIADGALLWQRRVQKAVPAARTGNLAEAHHDAVRGVIREIF
jgi:hypothetical protein